MAAINLTFDYIAVGIAVIEMDVDGKHYSFMSTYVGENPLNSLLSGLWYLKIIKNPKVLVNLFGKMSHVDILFNCSKIIMIYT